MDKKKSIILVVLALVLVAAFSMFNKNKETDMNNEGEVGVNIEESGVYRETKMNIEGTDIDGEKVDSEILKENELTMVNIWGTFCRACTEEMPELEELSKKLKKEGIGLVGIVIDANDCEQNIKLTKTILKRSNITFKNIIPSKKMQEKYLEDLQGFPTTVFLDKEGNIVGEPVLGAVGKEEFKKVALERLDTLREGK